MGNVRAYIARLKDNNKVSTIRLSDVPLRKPPRKIPAYLEKHELSKIMEYLERNVQFSKAKGHKVAIDAAYMWRAVVWFIYTTGLRNTELRSIKFSEINIDGMYANIVGK